MGAPGIDYRNPALPFALRALNAAGRPFARPLLRVGAADLLEAARRRTGLHDFGDPGFREPLEVLTRALEDEASLTPLGRFLARSQLVDALATRLRAEALLRERPEIADEAVDDPIVVLGLPRTGTTLLQRLLARDAGLRSLPYWEALAPLAEPDARDREADVGPRIERARRAISLLTWGAPLMRAMHELEALEPDEEIWLLGVDLATMLPEATWHVPSFRDWYHRADLRHGYRYLRRMLQILQWYRAGDRWLLKSPQHLERIPVLLETFPRAVVVQTHRDPAKVVGSFASMVAYSRRMSCAHPDPLAIGAYWADRIEAMLRRSVLDRPPSAAKRFVDVAFSELVTDPLAVVRRIYRTAGRELTREAERTMRDYLDAHPRGQHGVHRYELSDFGLDADSLRERMRFYTERFDVEAEPFGGEDG
jgi:hypothetical protein